MENFKQIHELLMDAETETTGGGKEISMEAYEECVTKGRSLSGFRFLIVDGMNRCRALKKLRAICHPNVPSTVKVRVISPGYWKGNICMVATKLNVLHSAFKEMDFLDRVTSTKAMFEEQMSAEAQRLQNLPTKKKIAYFCRWLATRKIKGLQGTQNVSFIVGLNLSIRERTVQFLHKFKVSTTSS